MVQYYIYSLTNSLDGQLFYINKGLGNRKYLFTMGSNQTEMGPHGPIFCGFV